MIIIYYIWKLLSELGRLHGDPKRLCCLLTTKFFKILSGSYFIDYNCKTHCLKHTENLYDTTRCLSNIHIGWDLAECGWDLADCGWDLAEWLERLKANAVIATVMGSIPPSSDTVESPGRHMKQKIQKIPLLIINIKTPTPLYWPCLVIRAPGLAPYWRAQMRQSASSSRQLPASHYFEKEQCCGSPIGLAPELKIVRYNIYNNKQLLWNLIRLSRCQRSEMGPDLNSERDRSDQDLD